MALALWSSHWISERMRRSSNTATVGVRRAPLASNRPVAAVTGDVLAAVRELAGQVELDLKPQETPWSTPLDQDTEHASYDADEVARYFACGDPRVDCPGRASRAVPWSLDAGQRVVGLLRPGREPVLR